MGIWSRQLGCSTLAIFLSGSVGWADVTADQVWSDFKEYLESVGYTVEGTEQASGGTLTISNLALAMDMPDQSGSSRMALDSITFAETGDGRVRVSVPDSMPITFSATSPEFGGEDIAGVIEHTQSGFDMIVSGDPDNMVYDYSADTLAFALNSLTVGGEAIAIDEARMQFSDMSGNSTTRGSDLRQITQTMSIATMSFALDMAHPEDPSGRISASGGLENLGFDGEIALPADVDLTDVAAAMQAGFSVDGGYTYENGASEFSFTGEGEVVEGNTTSAAGALAVRMNRDLLEYAAQANGIAMQFTGTQIPMGIPVSVDIGTAGFKMLMPVGQSEEPADFALGLTLADVTASDMIWAFLDPTAQLPRDPATIEIDLTGKARMTQDLMDPQAMAMAAGDPPGELHALTVQALTLAIGGARLTGNGDFTFDNEDLSTFPGMPKPTGALDLELTGGNALLDTLVAMGMLPQEQAMGARMMLGLFARPGDGPDNLTSRIEVNEEGQVLANGQRLR